MRHRAVAISEGGAGGGGRSSTRARVRRWFTFGEIVRAVDRPPEVDLHVEVLDAKLGISGVSPASLPRGVAAAFPGADRLVLVTAGGRRLMLTPGCEVVPLPDLYARLAETFPLRP